MNTMSAIYIASIIESSIIKVSVARMSEWYFLLMASIIMFL